MSAPSAADLQEALRALGFRVTIEAMDALAVAVAEAGERGFEDAERRGRAIALARRHGFSHLAVELTPDESDSTPRATLSRD
jgi:aspartate aminotransferase-like enzyme